MRVLITGHCGFIGQHLREAIRLAGHDWDGIDLKVLPTDDIRMALSSKLGEGCTHCVHLAAIASPNLCSSEPDNAWRTNVLGTYNVLKLCYDVGIRRVVFMSSAHVYGISPKYVPTDESAPLAMLDTYTVGKILGERLCELFYANHGLSYCALRLFNAFGVGQNQEYFIGKKLSEARAGGPVVMRTAVEDVTKDFVAVSDVVDAIVRALQSDYVGPLNVGTGREVRLRDVAKMIADSYGVPLVPDATGDPGPTRMAADWKRANRTLGWEPKVVFEDGLRELIKGAA